jgi:hypothetical protein
LIGALMLGQDLPELRLHLLLLVLQIGNRPPLFLGRVRGQLHPLQGKVRASQ